MDYTWTITRKNNSDVTAGAYIAQNPPSITRGQSTSVEFLFRPETTSSSAYSGMLDFLDFADAADYGLTEANVPWYREQLPARADVDSLVVQLDPSTELSSYDVPGFWGLVTGGDDSRESTLSQERLVLELFVLAAADQYTDHTAIETDLAA
jgi:hypothetical protein